MSTRILVTGASGFTGQYVLKELSKLNCDVFCLTDTLTATGRSVDLCDKNAVSSIIQQVSPNKLLHLAAISYVGHGDESEFYKVNVQGTLNLLNAVESLKTTVSSIVLASSANIYGSVNGSLPINESTPPNPQNAYAESKAQMEFEVQRLYSGMPITVVRPFNYTGLGQSEKFLVPKIVQAFIKRAKVLELGNLNISRDFSDVRYVATVYSDLLRRDGSLGTYNVCSGVSLSLKSIVDKCENFCKYRPELSSNKKFQRQSEIPILCGDNTKITKLLGYESKYTFTETLKWMLSQNQSGTS